MARGPLRGRVALPGDKSLSHRALILAAIAGGRTELSGLNPGEDVASTAAVLRALGVDVTRRGDRWTVDGEGAASFRRPRAVLDCGNSGTTMRLMAGVLAACPFPSRLTGDASLSRRPMGRIAAPLAALGGRIEGRRDGDRLVPPLRIDGTRLKAGRWDGAIASAQVKSAVLLAACVAGVEAVVTEPARSRDHTERMLHALGGDLSRVEGGARWRPGGRLRAPSGRVPGDPSAAAFLAAAAAGVRGSDVTLLDVCLNPTRLGFFRALRRMGADVTWARRRTWCGEPVGDVRVRARRLSAVRVGRRGVPAVVDEIPVLAVLAAGAARGVTRITGAEELRVKESDRIASLREGLARLGADVTERPDGLVITGGTLRGGSVDACGDHRLAMAYRVASLFADGPVRVRGASVARVSFPGFDRALAGLQGGGSR